MRITTEIAGETTSSLICLRSQSSALHSCRQGHSMARTALAALELLAVVVAVAAAAVVARGPHPTAAMSSAVHPRWSAHSPNSCHGGSCGGMAHYPVADEISFYAEFDVPAKPRKQDGLCYYIYFNIFFSGKGHGIMNQARAWLRRRGRVDGNERSRAAVCLTSGMLGAEVLKPRNRLCQSQWIGLRFLRLARLRSTTVVPDRRWQSILHGLCTLCSPGFPASLCARRRL